MRLPLAVSLACLLLTTFVPGPVSADTATTVGPYEGDLPVGMSELAISPRTCYDLADCQELEGISLVDLDLGDELEDAKALDGSDDDVLLRLVDSSWSYYLTTWVVCEYDGQGDRISCSQTYLSDYRHHELYVGLDDDTEQLRIIAKETAGASYYAKILVD